MNGKSTKEKNADNARIPWTVYEGRHIVYLVPRRPSLVDVLDVIKSGRFLFTSGEIFSGRSTDRKKTVSFGCHFWRPGRQHLGTLRSDNGDAHAWKRSWKIQSHPVTQSRPGGAAEGDFLIWPIRVCARCRWTGYGFQGLESSEYTISPLSVLKRVSFCTGSLLESVCLLS